MHRGRAVAEDKGEHGSVVLRRHNLNLSGWLKSHGIGRLSLVFTVFSQLLLGRGKPKSLSIYDSMYVNRGWHYLNLEYRFTFLNVKIRTRGRGTKIFTLLLTKSISIKRRPLTYHRLQVISKGSPVRPVYYK